MTTGSVHAVLALMAAGVPFGAVRGATFPPTGPGRPLLAVVQSGTPATASGTLRQLVCRGKAGIALRVHRDPSETDPSGKFVTMVLDYTRPTGPVGADFKRLQAGQCSWNPFGFSGVPVERGRVYFDVEREAQPWSALETRAMDTTAKAGAFHPDPISLPRYLGDPAHFWNFYVDDVTDKSNSFAAYGETARPNYVMVSGPIGPAVSPDTRKELRCRGGAHGLTFTRGATAGTNLVNMSLAYTVSANVPGETGRGLTAGTCAWVDRAGMPREPGRVDFTTAGNAQLSQTQSGSTVDRTATAAERYPDVNTIPVYLTDSNRYWSFMLTVGSPNTARTHGAWKADAGAIVNAKGPRDRSG